MVAVSVIMPVYNSEKYVRETIRSVLDQDFGNFELILVDDGSKDRSGAICDEIAQNDKRVCVIHKKNGGICSARNVGLKAARGEYIAFCDNDDEYLPGLLKENYEIAKKSCVDIVRYGRHRITSKNGRIIEDTVRNKISFQIIKSEHFVDHYERIRYMGLGVWTGLYKKEFLLEHRIEFLETIRYGLEDFLFNFECFQFCPSVALNPKAYYCWKQRLEHSTSGIFHENFLESLVLCMDKEQSIISQYHISERFPGLWQKLILNEHYFELFSRLSPEVCNNSDKEKKEILKTFRKNLNVDFSLRMKDLKVLSSNGLLDVIGWILLSKGQEYLLYRLIIWKKNIRNRIRNDER